MRELYCEDGVTPITRARLSNVGGYIEESGTDEELNLD